MKKIINGKKYDTETAKVLASTSFLSRNDFGFFCEGLYIKRTGEFFLAGEGGPASKYAHRCDDGGFDGGEKIFPLTEEEAREWAESNMTVDQYESVFGEVEE